MNFNKGGKGSALWQILIIPTSMSLANPHSLVSASCVEDLEFSSNSFSQDLTLIQIYLLLSTMFIWPTNNMLNFTCDYDPDGFY